MKFIVTYLRKKKKGYSNQKATFLTPEGAHHWINLVKSQGAQNIQLTVS
jgi:hypothetical protein